MVDGSLDFLDTRYIVAVHYKRKISQALALDLAAVVAEQRHRQQIAFPGFFQSHDDVARTATGGYADRNVFRASLRDQLAKENRVSANVVGDRGNVGWFQRK